MSGGPTSATGSMVSDISTFSAIGHLTGPRTFLLPSKPQGRPLHHNRQTKATLQSSSSLPSAVSSSSSPSSYFSCERHGAGPRDTNPSTPRVQRQAVGPCRRSITVTSPSMHPCHSSNRNQTPTLNTYALDPRLRNQTSPHQAPRAPSIPTPYTFHGGSHPHSSPQCAPLPQILDLDYRGLFPPHLNLPSVMPAHASPAFRWIHSPRIRSRMARHSAALRQRRRVRNPTHPPPQTGCTSQKHQTYRS
jgi:hypothetical protein